MSYARFGQDGSDVYVIGTWYGGGEQRIECCGCLLIPRGPLSPEEEEPVLARLPGFLREVMRGWQDWYLEDFPSFATKAGILEHLARHQSLGHHVPADCIARIREDDWVA